MGRWIAAWALLTVCRATTSVWAATADDYVLAARTALFERTVTGLVQVGELFAAAGEDTGCPGCAEDRELIFLHALAQTAMLFADHNDVLAVEDFVQLAETLGIPLAGLVFGAGEKEDLGVDDGRHMAASDTDAGELRQTVLETILPQLDVIIGSLEAIEDQPDPFIIYLVPAETGLAGDLEIDYGDVLIFRGLLSAYRGLLMTQFAEGANGVDADGARCQDALEAVLMALVEPDESMAFLSRARDDWTTALTYCLAAAEHIAGEDCPPGIDPQDDEFVYLDPDAQPRLEAYRQTLATLRRCLAAGADAADGVTNRKTYSLHSTDSVWFGELTLVFDLTGFEGTEGRLVLADGTSLDIDWFGLLDDERMGISMFSASDGLEGWLEVGVDGERGLVHEEAFELWGRRSATLNGLTGEAVTVGTLSAERDALPAAAAVSQTAGFDNEQDRTGLLVGPTAFCFEPDQWLASWFEAQEPPISLPQLLPRCRPAVRK
ncbi:MAG: hypothetical protein JSW27_25535 [Phycisphaerales bacterium]|nr:MAG: hypothetical protein JSW27_25535 [Phycisphaerales bacterium]